MGIVEVISAANHPGTDVTVIYEDREGPELLGIARLFRRILVAGLGEVARSPGRDCFQPFGKHDHPSEEYLYLRRRLPNEHISNRKILPRGGKETMKHTTRINFRETV